jgi:hypothetical protein
MKMAGRCLVDHPLISMVGGVDRSHEVPGSVAKHPVGASMNCSGALVPQSFQSYTKSPNDFFLVATLVF